LPRLAPDRGCRERTPEGPPILALVAAVLACIDLHLVHPWAVLTAANLRFARLFAPEGAQFPEFFLVPDVLPGFPGFLDDSWKSTMQRSPWKIAVMSIGYSF
jgi:hypothetical protein